MGMIVKVDRFGKNLRKLARKEIPVAICRDIITDSRPLWSNMR
jgi:hypothetical protein